MSNAEFDEKFEKHRDIHDNRPTLRDQFAMAFIAGPIAHWDIKALQSVASLESKTTATMAAECAYEFADAMLAERSRKP